ncbi:cytochrome c oxidase assembly factor Coa1 family protein [Cochleicola gelatinilyticus]|uniref:Cytochrome oxidase complex assembly protein 1 n=1 Tax=Cochleicola gelatinilyticus TaxID=1763537 RepID=A0A167IUF0_9FLAO|nr:cytochrome c oxidase assembly factor Coa1 family protein [Cochleicola gelatinilyticus]OAB80026.1 hypothetical protein ULVI_04610 [Cochleicola gelatinilyticus]
MEENIQRKSWFNRNWKWVVPTGGCLALIIFAIVFVGSIFFGVTSLLSDSQANIDAMERVRSNELVINRIGEPIESNGSNGGSINYENGYSSANITIPIKGPKGEAVIRVEGGGIEKTWTYEKMEVFLSETNEVIDLLNPNNTLDDF